MARQTSPRNENNEWPTNSPKTSGIADDDKFDRSGVPKSRIDKDLIDVVSPAIKLTDKVQNLTVTTFTSYLKIVLSHCCKFDDSVLAQNIFSNNGEIIANNADAYYTLTYEGREYILKQLLSIYHWYQNNMKDEKELRIVIWHLQRYGLPLVIIATRYLHWKTMDWYNFAYHLEIDPNGQNSREGLMVLSDPCRKVVRQGVNQTVNQMYISNPNLQKFPAFFSVSRLNDGLWQIELLPAFWSKLRNNFPIDEQRREASKRYTRPRNKSLRLDLGPDRMEDTFRYLICDKLQLNDSRDGHKVLPTNSRYNYVDSWSVPAIDLTKDDDEIIVNTQPTYGSTPKQKKRRSIPTITPSLPSSMRKQNTNKPPGSVTFANDIHSGSSSDLSSPPHLRMSSVFSQSGSINNSPTLEPEERNRQKKEAIATLRSIICSLFPEDREIKDNTLGQMTMTNLLQMKQEYKKLKQHDETLVFESEPKVVLGTEANELKVNCVLTHIKYFDWKLGDGSFLHSCTMVNLCDEVMKIMVYQNLMRPIIVDVSNYTMNLMAEHNAVKTKETSIDEYESKIGASFNSYKDNEDYFAIPFETDNFWNRSKQDKFALIIHRSKQKARSKFDKVQDNWEISGYMKLMDEELLKAMKKQFNRIYKNN